MIVLFANDKGGVGKTTTAVNMAVMRMLAGRDVLLADCDLQRTASNWCSVRAAIEPAVSSFSRVQLTGSDVASELIKLSERYQDVVVDTHGADSVEMRQAMTVADVVVMPLQMSQFDLWGVSRVLEVVKNIEATWPAGQKMNLKALINCAHTQAKKDKEEMREALSASGISVMAPVMHWRLVYQRLASKGLSVVEMKSSDPKGVATKEMTDVYQEIFGDEWRAK
ncbi:MAG: AAA family ATPase [Comamonas sp.]